MSPEESLWEVPVHALLNRENDFRREYARPRSSLAVVALHKITDVASNPPRNGDSNSPDIDAAGIRRTAPVLAARPITEWPY